jgi:hypothetical protein
LIEALSREKKQQKNLPIKDILTKLFEEKQLTIIIHKKQQQKN